MPVCVNEDFLKIAYRLHGAEQGLVGQFGFESHCYPSLGWLGLNKP